MFDWSDWRVRATIERLISNIPAACKVLEEEGYHSLAGQLRRDRDNLVCWQESGYQQEFESEEEQ